MAGDMELGRSALSLCLLYILAGVSAEPQCVVFTPGLLKSGESGKACLIAKHHTEPMDVDVSIEVNGTKIQIFKEQFPPGDVSKCSDFQVPEQKKASPVFILVEAISGNFNYTNRQPVVIAPAGNAVFIRPDKYKYRAGQTANIHILAVNNNLEPVDETFTLIYVMDPNGNRVKVWKNQRTSGDFLLLQFTFLDDPELGRYQIVAEQQSGKSVRQDIAAEDYVLPKYSITIKTSKVVTILDKSLSFEAFSLYTYGQPVPGKVSGRLCRPPSYYYVGDPCGRNPDGICIPFTGEIDAEGTYKGTVDLLALQFDRPGYNMWLNLEITVIEQGTGFQVTETERITITNTLGRAYFIDKVMLPYYKKQIPYPVEIMVEDGLGQPKSNYTVELQVNGKNVQNLTSDQDGKARYEIDTSGFGTSEIQLELIYTNAQQCYDSNWIVPTFSNDYRTIRRFFSPTQTFVQLQGPKEDLRCGETYNIRTRYVFGKDALEEGETTAKLYYLLMSRATIVESGEHQVNLSTSRQGEFNLTYKVLAHHVPTVQCVVFILLKNELAAGSVQLNLQKCFKHEVSLNFSSEVGTPGSNVDLQVKASPNSVCIARVMDSSILLMDQGQTLTADGVFQRLQYMQLTGFYYEGYSVQPPQPPCIDANAQIVYNSMYYQPVYLPQEGDTAKLLNSIGLLAMTNTSLQQQPLCSQPGVFRPSAGRPGMVLMASPVSEGFSTASATVNVDVSGPPEMVSNRFQFPEVWVMQRIPVDETGSGTQSKKVPGTITTWKGDVMCLSNQTGFGLSKYPANFTSFQEMFVDMSLPNSIVRGETMALVANVANYLDKCAKIKVTLEPSNDYTAAAVDGLPEKCVCSGQRVSYSWNVNATSLGDLNVTITAETVHIGEKCDGPADPNEAKRRDTIRKTFRVAPEGVEQDVTQTNFVCVKEGENNEVVFNINPSVAVVPGSLAATAQVIGDILGPALARPEALFNEPTGCGEQTLATLMPIPLIMDYLNLTGALTEEMRTRALQNMATGYIKLMRFANQDGSFNTFSGQGSSSASGWLTLQALRTMVKIERHVYVEARVIQQGQIYLASLQDLNTGSFKPKGTLFNQGLRGGADGDIGFTCAVVSFLLEKGYASTPTLLRLALAYLEAAAQKEQSVFNTIMLWHVFKVAGNTQMANAMFEKVQALAIDDGTIHWAQPLKPKPETPYLFSPPASSGEIEMAALALSTFLHGKTPSTISEADRTYATKIALFIVKQQRKMGGFRSTMDTVSALEALTSFGIFIIKQNAVNTVQLKKGNEVIREFTVDSSNRFTLQTERLTDLPGEYKMVVSGNGCVLLQTGVTFNVPFKKENPAFLLSLTTSPKDCQNGVAPTFDIQVNASYNGIQNTSNMVLIDIPLMSGHSVEYKSLSKLRTLFPKIEIRNNHLIIYLNELTKEGVSSSVRMERSAIVSNFQPKTSRISDYYERDENGAALLRHPCTL